MRHPATAKDFECDQGNVDKLAGRGILIHEVEGVWGNKPRFTRNKKAGSATWWMTGTDPVSGKRLKVGVLWAVEQDRTLRAITALDLSPTKKK